MNKKLITVAVIIMLLLVVGVAALAMPKKPSTQNTANIAPSITQGATQNANTDTSKTVQGTLKSLLTGNLSQKCTFSDSTDKTTVNTTLYAANGKMRMDAVSQSAEFSMTSHIIVDSGFSYMWTDKTNQGFKFPLEEPKNITPSPNSNTVDFNKPVNYSCVNWNKDDSLFVLPTNITFQELKVPTLAPSKAAGTPEVGTQGGTAQQCSVCNNLPAGEAQDACKTQLKCP